MSIIELTKYKALQVHPYPYGPEGGKVSDAGLAVAMGNRMRFADLDGASRAIERRFLPRKTNVGTARVPNNACACVLHRRVSPLWLDFLPRCSRISLPG